MRKTGTKASALKPKVDHSLNHFGKDLNCIDLAMSEEFLVNVYRPSTK